MQQSPAQKSVPEPPASEGDAFYIVARSVIVAFREAGVDVDALAERVGVRPGALAGPIPKRQADGLLTLAFEAVGDPGFGLTLGAIVRPELFGVAGFAAMSAPSYGAALARLSRYKRLFSHDRIEVRPAGPVTFVRVSMDTAGRSYGRQRVDAELAFLIAFGRRLTAHDLRPARVDLTGPPPSYGARYAAFFGCPIAFEAEADVVVLESADLERPLVSENAELAALFGDKAEQLLQAPEGSPDLMADRVRVALRRSLRGDPPDVRDVAKQLATSERSLQRKLQQEGTSFQQIVDEVRLELARWHLRQGRVDAGEVSFLLGFSHPNSFYRAFKRWTGMTPEEFRRSS